MSEHCEFGSSLTSLDEILRDRLVCGVNEDRIQRRLLAEPNRFKMSNGNCTRLETAAKDVRDLKGEMSNKRDCQMNKLHGGKDSDEYKECYRCGGKHDHTKCRFKKKTCHKCGKIGHIAKVCRSSRSTSSEKGQQKQKGKNFRKEKRWGSEINKVEQKQSDEELAYNLFSLKDKTVPYRENLTVNDIDISMEIDTGASFSVINEKTFQEISRGKENLALKQTEISLRTSTLERKYFREELLKWRSNTIIKFVDYLCWC